MNLISALTRNGFLACSGLALAISSYAVASAPTRVAERLGLRGLMRQRAIEKSQSWAAIEPLVRWLGVRMGGLLTDGMYADIDAFILKAGDYLGLTPEEYLALALLSGIGGALFGVLAAAFSDGNQLFFAVTAGVFALAIPHLQISDEMQKRHLEINRGLPYVIDLMALAMSAGLDFPGAVRQVVEKSPNQDDPLIFELRRILQELQLGKTRKQALSEFGTRCPTTQVKEFVAAVTQAEDRGNPVSDVLQIQAGVARMHRSVKAEEAASQAAVKLIGPLVMLFACIMLLLVGPIVLRAMDASKN